MPDAPPGQRRAAGVVRAAGPPAAPGGRAGAAPPRPFDPAARAPRAARPP